MTNFNDYFSNKPVITYRVQDTDEALFLRGTTLFKSPAIRNTNLIEINEDSQLDGVTLQNNKEYRLNAPISLTTGFVFPNNAENIFITASSRNNSLSLLGSGNTLLRS